MKLEFELSSQIKNGKKYIGYQMSEDDVIVMEVLIEHVTECCEFYGMYIVSQNNIVHQFNERSETTDTFLNISESNPSITFDVESYDISTTDVNSFNQKNLLVEKWKNIPLYVYDVVYQHCTISTDQDTIQLVVYNAKNCQSCEHEVYVYVLGDESEDDEHEHEYML